MKLTENDLMRMRQAHFARLITLAKLRKASQNQRKMKSF